MEGNTWRRVGLAALCGIVAGVMAPQLQAARAEEAAQTPAPIAIPLPTEPPAGAVLLFTGKPEQMKENWFDRGTQEPCGWTVADGIASPTNKKDITSKQEFGDCFMHAEFWCPADADGKPVTSGNSGIGFQGRYEVQILNSFGKQPEAHECAALYSQKAPICTASKPAGQWQTYDIIFRAPRFNDKGEVVEQARATVFQNGILVQNNEAFNGPTGLQYGDFKGQVPKGPFVLQGNHDPVKFRNIWVIPLQ